MAITPPSFLKYPLRQSTRRVNVGFDPVVNLTFENNSTQIIQRNQNVLLEEQTIYSFRTKAEYREILRFYEAQGNRWFELERADFDTPNGKRWVRMSTLPYERDVENVQASLFSFAVLLQYHLYNRPGYFYIATEYENLYLLGGTRPNEDFDYIPVSTDFEGGAENLDLSTYTVSPASTDVDVGSDGRIILPNDGTISYSRSGIYTAGNHLYNFMESNAVVSFQTSLSLSTSILNPGDNSLENSVISDNPPTITQGNVPVTVSNGVAQFNDNDTDLQGIFLNYSNALNINETDTVTVVMADMQRSSDTTQPVALSIENENTFSYILLYYAGNDGLRVTVSAPLLNPALWTQTDQKSMNDNTSNYWRYFVALRGVNEYKAGIYDGTNGYTTPWYTNDDADFNDNVRGISIGGFQPSITSFYSWDDKIKNVRIIKGKSSELTDSVLNTITTDYTITDPITEDTFYPSYKNLIAEYNNTNTKVYINSIEVDDSIAEDEVSNFSFYDNHLIKILDVDGTTIENNSLSDIGITNTGTVTVTDNEAVFSDNTNQRITSDEITRNVHDSMVSIVSVKAKRSSDTIDANHLPKIISVKNTSGNEVTISFHTDITEDSEVINPKGLLLTNSSGDQVGFSIIEDSDDPFDFTEYNTFILATRGDGYVRATVYDDKGSYARTDWVELEDDLINSDTITWGNIDTGNSVINSFEGNMKSMVYSLYARNEANDNFIDTFDLDNLEKEVYVKNNLIIETDDAIPGFEDNLGSANSSSRVFNILRK